MPSTKVNVAQVLDEIQLADLNPDTKDAVLLKSLETLRDTFICRAVLDVSEVGRDVEVVFPRGVQLCSEHSRFTYLLSDVQLYLPIYRVQRSSTFWVEDRCAL